MQKVPQRYDYHRHPTGKPKQHAARRATHPQLHKPMLDTTRIPPRLMAELMDALSDPMADSIVHPDPVLTAKVAKLNVYEAFNTWLNYVGIIGYTSQIITALDSIREAEISHQINSAEG